MYHKGDEEFRNEKFYKRVIHYEIDYEECLEQKQDCDEYLYVTFYKYLVKEVNEIPPGVTRIDDDCFKERDDIIEIIMPDSVTSIGDCCFPKKK